MKRLLATILIACAACVPASAAYRAPPVKTLDAAALQAILADLAYAKALAKQNNNIITLPCLTAINDLLSGWQAPLKDDQGNVIQEPAQHIISSMERIAELINQIQPNSPVSLGCAAMQQAVKKDVVAIIGAVLSGSALGLFTLPLPLPIP